MILCKTLRSLLRLFRISFYGRLQSLANTY